MNTLENILEAVSVALQQLGGAPAGLLVMFGCIVLGYCLKMVKRFPNQAIPLAVILFGAVVYPIIADTNNAFTLRVWLVRNVLIGLVIGLLAWMLHNQVIKRIEGKIRGKQ